MIRHINLILTSTGVRLQGHTLSKDDLVLLLSLHGFVVHSRSMDFYNSVLQILAEIPEDLLNNSLSHFASLEPEDKVFYTRMARQKIDMLDFLGKN